MKKLFTLLPLVLVGSLCAMEDDTLPMDSSSTKDLSLKMLNHCRESSSLEELKEFLEQGADINYQDEIGETLRHIVAVLDAHLGETLLHIAAIQGAPIKVRFLLSQGARIDISNKAGDIPIISLVIKYRGFVDATTEAACMLELKSIVSEKIHGTQDNLTPNCTKASFRELLFAHLLLSITEDQTTQAYNIAKETVKVCRHYGVPKDIIRMIVNQAIKEAVLLIILNKIKHRKPIPATKIDIVSALQDITPQTFKDLIEQITKAATIKRIRLSDMFFTSEETEDP